ncbi:MAG: hypothetical protein V7703_07575 [Hyphomicrobiales bacterium]
MRNFLVLLSFFTVFFVPAWAQELPGSEALKLRVQNQLARIIHHAYPDLTGREGLAGLTAGV